MVQEPHPGGPQRDGQEPVHFLLLSKGNNYGAEVIADSAYGPKTRHGVMRGA